MGLQSGNRNFLAFKCVPCEIRDIRIILVGYWGNFDIWVKNCAFWAKPWTSSPTPPEMKINLELPGDTFLRKNPWYSFGNSPSHSSSHFSSHCSSHSGCRHQTSWCLLGCVKSACWFRFQKIHIDFHPRGSWAWCSRFGSESTTFHLDVEIASMTHQNDPEATNFTDNTFGSQ